VGAVEFGELHVAIVKSFGLVLAVNLISLVPYVGVYVLAPIVWISGLVLLFRLDMWETFMVMFFNWVLNYLIRLLLFAMFTSWLLHGGPSGGIRTAQSLSRPVLEEMSTAGTSMMGSSTSATADWKGKQRNWGRSSTDCAPVASFPQQLPREHLRWWP
jgi:hypothetical protein